MAKELSILLTAKDLASKTIGKVSREVGGLGRVSKLAGVGVSNLATNLTRIGAVGIVALGAAVKSGLSDLSTLNSAITSVDGAIKQAGLTGQATGSQIAAWAMEIEDNVGAAFDEKPITQATATLIRFGKLAPGNIRPAMQIITDLATKTGDVESAATLLAKALADPEKAAGKLARSGVILTKAEQEQIKAFVKAGKTAEAQKVILDSLSKTTAGAALASQDEYTRGLSVMADAAEHARMALAVGFLPVITKVADKLSKGMADPKVIAGIREFGTTLAGSLDSLIGIAENLPWGAIGDSLKIAGAGARMVLDAFVNMPPWVQGAILTGWGLNKLTGGALGSIVGELGKGLIKGVLGINAGVVNLKAGAVTGVGGGVGGGVTGAGKGGVAGALAGAAKVIMVGIAAGVAVELASALADQSGQIREQGKTLVESAQANAPQMTRAQLAGTIGAIDAQIDPRTWSGLALDITNGLNGGKDALLATRKELSDRLAAIERIGQGYERTSSALLTTLQGKNFSPVINVQTGFTVNTSVSVRDVGLRTAVRSRVTRTAV